MHEQSCVSYKTGGSYSLNKQQAIMVIYKNSEPFTSSSTAVVF